ncbi:hypothetical protein MJO28_015335 [Puccinia striiformis f. sp. tritici]|uniref:Uncharacterized protein n=1 Tax=Puccinia striiformis f. sp. tritici TaxID=168172 RepID=A0ACC0DUA3_9BASI|nr:hypothetical protein MJO28_015335 [Puccinia striiformis f. sp. tritici]
MVPADNTEERIRSSPRWTVPHNLGECNRNCQSCGALHWTVESTVKDCHLPSISFSSCCQKNQVTLPAFAEGVKPFPERLQQLFTGNDAQARNFQSLLRMYNNSVSFTSLGAKIDNSVRGKDGTSDPGTRQRVQVPAVKS